MIDNSNTPLVSVVIPTHGRPELVKRAVGSALDQTFLSLEVIVVIDGVDADTTNALSTIQDPRLHTICLAERVGGAEARNTGVRSSQGSWIAFLDDDDEWLPQKLEKQLAVARTLPGEFVFVACRFIERSSNGDRLLPARSLRIDRSFSEFLFCRDGLFEGTGYVQTSTWLVSKKLATTIPFTTGLKRNQDVDWMIRAAALADTKIAILPEGLSLFYDEENARNRVSRVADWQFHYNWAMSNRQYIAPTALAYFLSTICVEDAARQNASRAAIKQIFDASRNSGKMTVKCFLFFCYYWLLPQDKRHRWRNKLTPKIRV